MTLMPRPGCDRDVLDVAVVHGCASSLERETCLPAGHCLSRARSRHLRESDWVIVTDDSVPVGLAAYKHARTATCAWSTNSWWIGHCQFLTPHESQMR